MGKPALGGLRALGLVVLMGTLFDTCGRCEDAQESRPPNKGQGKQGTER